MHFLLLQGLFVTFPLFVDVAAAVVVVVLGDEASVVVYADEASVVVVVDACVVVVYDAGVVVASAAFLGDDASVVVVDV